MTKYFERDCWILLGLPFDAVTLDSAAEYIKAAVHRRVPCFMSTPNINFSITAQHDETFFESVVASDLSIADGMPLIWLAKLLKVPITERVAGSDLFEYLSGQHIEPPIKVFFFGGPPGIAQQAHEKLNQQARGMTSCGYYDPGFGSVEQMSSATIIETINNAEPDFILVALGAKKGQTWIQHNKTGLHAPVISHLGAVINFVAGTVDRAPETWRRVGMEWLWRIKQEPALWQRYWHDGIGLTKLLLFNVFPLAVYDRFLHLKKGADEPMTITHEPGKIRFQGSLNHAGIEDIKNVFRQQLEMHQQDLVLDLSAVTYIDGAFMANLLLLQHYLHQQHRSLLCLKPNPRIKRLLRFAGVLGRIRVTSAEA